MITSTVSLTRQLLTPIGVAWACKSQQPAVATRCGEKADGTTYYPPHTQHLAERAKVLSLDVLLHRPRQAPGLR